LRAVIQKVSTASVSISGEIVASISKGLVILIGIEETDSEDDIGWLVSKISNMRIFEDDNQKMNLSCQDINGDYIVVSQFTLHASTKKGNRPSFIKAAKPEIAIPIYERFLSKLSETTGKKIQSGEFGAFMDVNLVNSGPVTIIMDTKNKE
jgi:D-tyrosyl-tRNA(Tyr) deacylase